VSGPGEDGQGRLLRRWRFREDRPILARLLRAFAGGVAGGAVTAAALVATDVGGIRDLVLAGGMGLVGGFLLAWGMMLLFGFVSLAISVFTLGDWSDRPGRP
jgi:hypothetical protein